MFFRWPWDGAATLLGPSGRPLATSPAGQGAARDYGGGGAQTAAQGRKGCRRAERAGNQHHACLARYMDRAARWLQHTAPATATGSHGGRGTVVRAEANPAASGPRRVAHGAAETATGHQLRGPTTTATAGPHCELDGAPKAAASSAGSNTRQRKPAPLAPAHVAATGSRSTKSGGRGRGGNGTQRQRPHRGRQLQRTATAAAGIRRAAKGGAAARRPHRGSQLQRTAIAAEPGERRTADQTGNKSNGPGRTL